MAVINFECIICLLMKFIFYLLITGLLKFGRKPSKEQRFEQSFHKEKECYMNCQLLCDESAWTEWSW